MTPRYYVETQYSATAGLSSHAIAWWGFGWDGYSHTDAVLPNGHLIGARWDNPGGHGTGVRERPPNYELWLRVSRVRIPVSQAVQKRWIEFLQSVVGDKYDPDNIATLILGKKPKEVPNHFICSALQTVADVKAEIFTEEIGKISHQISPDVHRLMSMVIPDAQMQTIIP